jgi:hypothetical protein
VAFSPEKGVAEAPAKSFGEESHMYEAHLGLILAVIALWIAARRQPRLPTYRLEWNDISARDIYAERLIVGPSEGKQSKRVELSVDKEGHTLIAFPQDHIEGETWRVLLRCGRGEGGFRFDFILEPPDEPPHDFLSLAFSPAPVQVTLFDGKNKLVAKLP